MRLSYPHKIFNPLKSLAAILSYAYITGWQLKPFLQWASRRGNISLAGTGVDQIGCFGLKPHVVWEMTSACNLRCIHCHADGGKSYPNELDTFEGKKILDSVAASGIRIFVFSGGEPFLRHDFLELVKYGHSKGLHLFIATNGTLITENLAKKLKEQHVGVVIGLDAMNQEIHEKIRGVEGTFTRVIRAIEICRSNDLYVHLNITATRLNLEEIEKIIDFGNLIGVHSFFIYNMIQEGRGKGISWLALSKNERIKLIELIAKKQINSRAILIPIALPEYWAHLFNQNGIRKSGVINFLGHFLGGCMAGKGLLYIKPDGDIWPCPFLSIRLGNVRKDNFSTILDMFLKGSYRQQSYCISCRYFSVCGGCKTLKPPLQCHNTDKYLN